MVFQEVMRSKLLSPESKAIYAYLASFAGSNDTCYPTKDLMCSELCMSENRLSKHIKPLVELGVIEVNRQNKGGLRANNEYRIIHSIRYVENRCLENRGVENREVENRFLENMGTNINNFNNNNLNNNSIKNNNAARQKMSQSDNSVTTSDNNVILCYAEKEIEKENRINYQQIADMYNDTCVSFPKVTKLSESRKKAIKARLRTYTPEDFQQLFQMAEESDFLKGANARNWSANFDWLITDSNMCKVLSGNYSNRKESSGHTQEKNASNNRFINFEQRTYNYEQLEREFLNNQE